MEHVSLDISIPIIVPEAGTVGQLVVKARSGELPTTVTLLVDSVSVGEVCVPANPLSARAKTFATAQSIEVQDGSTLSYAASAGSTSYDPVSVTKFPTAGLPTWETWEIGGEIPSWFSQNTARKRSTVIMTARANQEVFVRGTVSSWDSATKKFRITLTEVVGNITPYNSWSMSLDPEAISPATIETVSVAYDYEIPPAPPEAEPAPPPIRKKRRIMM